MIMKKLSYTTILAAACLLLPGCSDDAADKGLVSPDVLVADSEVEIKLSSNSSNMTTRAGLYDEEEFSTPTQSTIAGKEPTSPRLALFCLATGTQQNAAGATAIDWTKAKGTYNDVKLYNDPARVWKGQIYLDTPDFYPLSNWYTYSFYGFYTKQTYDSYVVKTADRIDATININGYDDVIWGKSIVNEEDIHKDFAYSAKYYREHIKSGSPADAAQMKFDHMLTSFIFTVTPMDKNARGVEITSIKLKNQPKFGKLCIASSAVPTDEGKIIVHPEQTGVYPTITLHDVTVVKDEETLAETLAPATFSITEDLELKQPVMVGGDDDPAAFYVMPNQDSYTLVVTMTKDGNTFPATEMEIPATNVNAGTRSTINLAIYGPQEISLKAKLTPWNDVVGPEFEL